IPVDSQCNFHSQHNHQLSVGQFQAESWTSLSWRSSSCSRSVLRYIPIPVISVVEVVHSLNPKLEEPFLDLAVQVELPILEIHRDQMECHNQGIEIEELTKCSATHLSTASSSSNDKNPNPKNTIGYVMCDHPKHEDHFVVLHLHYLDQQITLLSFPAESTHKQFSAIKSN
ncbi:hypothetical protein AGLY_007478, partial [Aphis glycines]